MFFFIKAVMDQLKKKDQPYVEKRGGDDIHEIGGKHREPQSDTGKVVRREGRYVWDAGKKEEHK